MFLRNNRNLRSQDKAWPQNLERQANTEKSQPRSAYLEQKLIEGLFKYNTEDTIQGRKN